MNLRELDTEFGPASFADRRKQQLDKMFYYGLEWQSLDSYFQVAEISTPDTPPANEIRLYAKDSSGTSTLCYKNDAGVEVCLPTAGPFVTGSGVANQVAFFTDTSTIGGDTDLTFITDTLTATKIVGVTSITDSALTVGSVVFAGAAGLLSQDNTNFFWDDTNNWLGLGTATPDFRLSIRGTNNANAALVMRETSADTVAAQVQLNKFRGTPGSEAATNSGDTLGAFGFGGWTNAEKFNAARIEALAGSLWSATNAESLINFQTTPNASVTRATRFQIGSAGQWGIGGATFGTVNNVFKSGGANAAPSWGTVNILDSDSHGDTLTGTVVRGDLIVGNATPKWSRFAKGANGTILQMGANDPAWVALSTIDHGSLGGLTDDDHTQYLLLAGRSSNTNDPVISTGATGTIYGSDDSLGTLALQGSNHANGGFITVNSYTITGAFTFPQGAVTIQPTISTSSSDAIALSVSATFTGAGESPSPFLGRGVFQPSASIANATAFVGVARAEPASTITITNLINFFSLLNTASTAGAITNAYSYIAAAPLLGSLKPANTFGMNIENHGAASITNAIGLRIAAQSGATNNWTMELPATGDTPTVTWTALGTFPPSTAPAGYIRILVGGNTRYMPFWA